MNVTATTSTMSSLFPNDTLANRISYYHLLLLLVSLPFNLFFSHIILISFGIHTLIHVRKSHFKRLLNWQLPVLQSVFLITVVTTLYSDNKPEAFNEWARQSTILLLPLFLALTQLDLKKYRRPLLFGFSLVCTFTVCYLFANAFHTIRYYRLPLSSIFSAAFANHNFSQPIAMHATFFSMQIFIALLFFITACVNTRVVLNKALYSICILILLAGLMQLCAKSVLFCLLMIINFVLPFYLSTGKRRWVFMTAALAFTFLSGFVVLQSATLKERLFTELKTDLSAHKTDEVNDSRMERWAVAVNLISQSPVTGHGAGTEISLLHEAYFRNKYYRSFLNNLNVHNQFLSFLIKSGIIGLLVYLGTLAYGYRKALVGNNLQFLCFMLLITFVSTSEDYLDVDKGIFFYAFFFSFFVLTSNLKTTVVSLTKTPLLFEFTGNQQAV